MSIPLLLSGLALAAAGVVICWDRHRLAVLRPVVRVRDLPTVDPAQVTR